jgi:ParB-like chromosome segregation protein Spo0J
MKGLFAATIDRNEGGNGQLLHSKLPYFLQMVEGLYPQGVLGGGGIPLWGHTREGEKRAVVRIPLSRLKPLPPFVRIPYAPEKVMRMEESIASQGLLQPLLGIALPSGGFGVLDGRLRLEAISNLARKQGADPEAVTVPIALLGANLSLVQQLGLALHANEATPPSPLERAVAFVSACAYGGVGLDELETMLSEINRQRAKKLFAQLASYAVVLKALAYYGISAARATYYVRVFNRQPDLLELVRAGKVSERLFRQLAKPRVLAHPLFPNLIDQIRKGVSEEEVLAMVREMDREEASEEDRAYRHWLKLLKRQVKKGGDPRENLEALKRALAELEAQLEQEELDPEGET